MSFGTIPLSLDDKPDGFVLLSMYKKLESENAKLRELAKELWEGYMDPQCEDCPLKHKPACVDCPICAREAAVIDRMREMGVEVDG